MLAATSSIYMKTPRAKPHKGFTLVEIMIVVAIIALLAAIAVPGFLRARKRSQASRILNDLRMIDSAVDQYAIETAYSGPLTVPRSWIPSRRCLRLTSPSYPMWPIPVFGRLTALKKR
jgi:prepilin-type N-terminal cleavage/methylation domain-containing protein